jgi:hypothetical protein
LGGSNFDVYLNPLTLQEERERERERRGEERRGSFFLPLVNL